MNTKLLTVVLAGLAMIGPFAIDTYLPSFPAIAEHFTVAPALVQQTLSVYLFAFSLMNLFYGTLSDSFGRRPVILFSLVLFTAASIGAALSASFTSLLVFRALQGASAGAGMVIGQAIVRDRFQGADAQRFIANIMMVFGIAPAVAPVIGGLLHVAFGWRSTFAFMTAIGIILLIACCATLRETLPAASRQPFRAAAIAGNYWTALRHPQFLLRAFGAGFAFSGFALYISSAASFVMQVLHLPETAFGWLFIPMVAGMVIGSAASGRLAHRVSLPGMVRRGFLVMAAAAAINLTYTSLFAPAVPWAVLPIMLYAFGMAMAVPAMSVMTQSLFPQMRGLAASLQNFIQMLIFALVSGFVAPLLFDSAFKMAEGVAVGLVLAMACWTLGSKEQVASPTASPAKDRPL
jgi:DHA1 family bicyclomycin/chloramphenicol resistance-like MFS transporter